MSRIYLNLHPCRHLASVQRFNWPRLAHPSNPAVSLLHPRARRVFLTNYCCCLRWSVTPLAPAELPSPPPFTVPVNILPHFHTSVGKKICKVEQRIDRKMMPFQKAPARLMTVKKQSSGSSSLGGRSLYFIANAQSRHLCCLNYCYVNHLKCFGIGKQQI